MGSEQILELGSEAIKTTLLLSAPLLICALVVGLTVSIFQAVTQINEATLSFIPKIAAVAIALVISGPWMIDVMKRYTTRIFENIGTMVR